jgi:hypothetical protein
MAKKKASGKAADKAMSPAETFAQREGAYQQISALSRLGVSEDVEERNRYRDDIQNIAYGRSGGTTIIDDSVSNASVDRIYAGFIKEDDEVAGGYFADHKRNIVTGIKDKGLVPAVFGVFHAPEGSESRQSKIKSVNDFATVAGFLQAYQSGEKKAYIPTNDSTLAVNDGELGKLAAPFVAEGVDKRYEADELSKYVSGDTRDAVKGALQGIVFGYPTVAFKTANAVAQVKQEEFEKALPNDSSKAGLVRESIVLHPDERKARAVAMQSYFKGEESGKKK